MNVLTNSKGRTAGGDVKTVAAVVGSNCEKERKKKERDK